MVNAENFEQYLKRRQEASRAYVQGNAGPLSEIVARSYPSSFFPPTGGFTQGAEEVAARYARDAGIFSPGGDFSMEILHIAAGDDIAYWVGFMRGKARMRGKAEAVPMNLRVTEVFRRENGEWKMIHRHADPLIESKKMTDV